MMNFLARDIASRLHLRGALICPEHANVAADLRDISNFDINTVKAAFDVRKAEIVASYGFSPSPQTKPFAFADGAAIIPIHGMLVNRMSWGSSFATGYNFIASQLDAALDDPDVQAIVFDVNSYGGIASGCGELAQQIFDAREKKPTMAMVDSKAYSAAIYLASAAERVVVTPSGGVGSIGCVAMHTDLSGMLEQEGIKVTFIHAGDEKVDGNPFEKLSSRARASMQRDVDYHYGLFTDAVAKFRDLPVEDIRGTEAACYLPPEALDIGLIDAIDSPAHAVAEFVGGTSSSNSGATSSKGESSTSEGVEMDEKEIQALVANSVSTAVSSALAAERNRQSGIRTCEEAKGRESLADHLANNTEMTVEQAKSVLAAAPKVEPKSADNSGKDGGALAAAMARTGNPNLKPDSAVVGGTGQPGEDDTPQARAGRMLGAYGIATGKVIDLKPEGKAA